MEPKKSTTSFLYISILLILLVVGCSFFLQSSFFTIEKVSLEGLEMIPSQEIELLTADVAGQNLIMLDQRQLKAKILLHPLVEDVKFQRGYPDTLTIKVMERTPVALINMERGVIEVDSKGIYLRRHEGWPKKSLPVINGVSVPETAGPGQELNLPNLQAALLLLGQAPGELKDVIGEIYINSVQQITLYLIDGIEVRLGQSQQWTEKLEALVALLNDEGYNAIKSGVKYIDYTAAKPVIGR